MSKVLISVISGIFIGAILYELFTRSNQVKAVGEAGNKVEEQPTEPLEA